MHRPIALSLAAALAVAGLGACSKPASQTAADASAATSNAADSAANTASTAGAGATEPGGAVSPPESNGAVNSDANKTETDTASASNSFTEDQARGHIQNAGYTDVTALTKTPDGMWAGKAKKGGKSVDVTVDFKGAVSAK